MKCPDISLTNVFLLFRISGYLENVTLFSTSLLLVVIKIWDNFTIVDECFVTTRGKPGNEDEMHIQTLRV